MATKIQALYAIPICLQSTVGFLCCTQILHLDLLFLWGEERNKLSYQRLSKKTTEKQRLRNKKNGELFSALVNVKYRKVSYKCLGGGVVEDVMEMHRKYKNFIIKNCQILGLNSAFC